MNSLKGMSLLSTGCNIGTSQIYEAHRQYHLTVQWNLCIMDTRAAPILVSVLVMGPIPAFFDGIRIGQVCYTTEYQFCCLCIINHEIKLSSYNNKDN